MNLEDRMLLIAEFDRSIYPGGEPTLQDAWMGIYQVIWWYEHGLLHVHDAPALWTNARWNAKAQAAERYVAAAMGIDAAALEENVDRMMRLPRWEGMQRQNPVGHGFRTLLAEILTRWGDSRFEFREESRATNYYPGIEMPGRSKAPMIDVVAVSKQRGTPKAIISCKWSIRHDRISDPTNECTQYKRASIQLQEMDLLYFVVTNEVDGQRMDKVINQPCVDGLVHVNLPFVEEVNSGLTESMTAARAAARLFDLTDLVQATFTWP